MKREHLAFLVAGLAFGVLIGLAIGQFGKAPESSAAAAIPAPAGPAAPTQTGAGAAGAAPTDDGAPMMREIAALRARLAEQPDDLPTLTRLANLYHDVQMWEPAKTYYERAVALSPSDPDLITDWGVCYAGTGDFDRALALFDRAQEARPGHSQSLFNTAVVAGLYAGDFARADAAIARLEQIDPAPPRLAELKADIASARAARGPAGS